MSPPSSRLESLLAALALAELPRTGWLQAGLAPGVPAETIAGHSHLVALLVLRLGPEVRPALDVLRATAMATAHDVAESELGDLPQAASRALPAGAKTLAEETVMATSYPELEPLCAEFRAQKTREARFVRLCDKLQMGLFALRLSRAGHRGLGSFLESLEALDCSEFQPAEALHIQLRAALRGLT